MTLDYFYNYLYNYVLNAEYFCRVAYKNKITLYKYSQFKIYIVVEKIIKRIVDVSLLLFKIEDEMKVYN